MKKIIIPVAILFIAFLDPFADRVNKGNDEYNDGKYKEAEKSYNEAEAYLPSKKLSPALSFNVGDARFKQGDYDGAIDNYKKALESEDPSVQKKALYNLGNAYLQKKDKISAAEAYVDALRIDPSYEKAKKNLEYIYKKKNDDKKENQNDKDGGAGSKGNESEPDKDKGNKSGARSLNREQLGRMMDMMKNKPLRKENKKGGRTDPSREKPW